MAKVDVLKCLKIGQRVVPLLVLQKMLDRMKARAFTLSEVVGVITPSMKYAGFALPHEAAERAASLMVQRCRLQGLIKFNRADRVWVWLGKATGVPDEALTAVTGAQPVLDRALTLTFSTKEDRDRWLRLFRYWGTKEKPQTQTATIHEIAA